MTQFIVSSALTRLLANLFVFMCLLAALIAGAVEVLGNQPINPLVYTLLSSGLIYAVSTLSVHTGVVAGGLTQSVPDPVPVVVDPKIAMSKMQTANMNAIRLPPIQS